MSQMQLIQAGVQIEAGRELGKLIRPLMQRIIRCTHGLRLTDNELKAKQLRAADKYPADMPLHSVVPH